MNVDTVLSLCAAHLPEGYTARHNPNGAKIEVWPPSSIPEAPTLFLIDGSETAESLILTIVTVTWQHRLRVYQDEVAAALQQASRWRSWGIGWSTFPLPANQETRARDDDGLRTALAERIEKGIAAEESAAVERARGDNAVRANEDLNRDLVSIRRVAEQYLAEEGHTPDPTASTPGVVAALGSAYGFARSQWLGALRQLGMPAGCHDPLAWASSAVGSIKSEIRKAERAERRASTIDKPCVQVCEVDARSTVDLAATAAALYSERRHTIGAMGFEVRAYHRVFKATMKLRFEPSAQPQQENSREAVQSAHVADPWTAPKIAAMFPAAESICIIDLDARGSGWDPRVMFINADTQPASAIQEQADVVVRINGDALQVLKNRQGEPGGLLTPGLMDPAIKRALEGSAPAKAPCWTGITWTSRKGKARSMTMSGLSEAAVTGYHRNVQPPRRFEFVGEADANKLYALQNRAAEIAVHLADGSVIRGRMTDWIYERIDAGRHFVIQVSPTPKG